MATRVQTQEYGAILYRTVQRWESRLRWQRLVAWLPFSIIIGLLIGVLLGFAARLRPLLLPDQLLLITIGAAAASVAALFLMVFLRPRTSLQSARHFDVLFGLQERVSTALELIEGRIPVVGELAGYQLRDAVSRAQDTPIKDELPLRHNWRAWAAIVPLLIAFVLLLMLPNPQVAAISALNAQRAALDEAVEEIKDLTEQVAADTTLTDQERAELLQALQSTRETLERPDVGLEEAFASLSDVESQLQDQSSLFDQRLNEQREALEAAAEALRNQMQSNSTSPEDEAGISEMLDSLAESAAGMSAEEQQDLADALRQAADALAESNPEAAQNLMQASESLQQGALSQAQQQMLQAQQQLQQDAQQAQQQEQLSQQLQQGAQQLSQRQEQLSQQGQQQDSSQQQMTMNPAGQPQQANQPGQGSQETDTNDTPNSQNQPGAGENAQSGAPQAGQNDAQQANQDANQQGNTPGDAANAAGASAGDSPGDAGSEEDNAGESRLIEGDNTPDGQGEGEFESIFTPRRIGGQGTEQIVLEPDSSNVPAIEGEFAENLTGNVSVPYNQVFSDYSDAANRALESDYIPLGLRDVVRDYFSSLEPGE